MALLLSFSVLTIAQNHPFDALTREEIVAATKIVIADPRMRDLKFQLITLLEPAKLEVLSWKAGDGLKRRASVTGRRDAEVFEIDVDLTTKVIASVKILAGVEIPISIEESSAAIETVRRDARMLEALKKRSFADPKTVDCAPFTVAYYSIKAHEGQRLLRVGCFEISRSTNNIFGWPIEKLYALADLRKMTVIEVVDDGIVPVSPAEMNFTKAATAPLRSVEKPTLIAQPRGKNFILKGSEVSWGNWRFHLRFENRQGTVISLARWSERGRERHVMYQGYMSEMFVPYMDPMQVGTRGRISIWANTALAILPRRLRLASTVLDRPHSWTACWPTSSAQHGPGGLGQHGHASSDARRGSPGDADALAQLQATALQFFRSRSCGRSAKQIRKIGTDVHLPHAPQPPRRQGLANVKLAQKLTQSASSPDLGSTI